MSRSVSVVLFLFAPVCLRAASFDCLKAQTAIEKAICSSPKLSAADDKLAQAYRTALTNVPEAAELVRESQRTWLQSLQRSCPEDKDFSYCLTMQWEERIDSLGHIAVRKGGVPFFFREVLLDKPCDRHPEDNAGDAESGTRADAPADRDSDDDSCPFDATWPEAISEAPQWQAWNKALLDEARRFNASQDLESQIPDHWVHSADPTWHHPGLEVSVNLNWASSSLVAATINRNYTYAHPAHEERAFNWLLKRGRELKPDDLFQPDSGWRAWMKERVAQIVLQDEPSRTTNEAADAKETAAAAAGISVESRYWQIERKGLSLMFTEDELGYLTALNMPDITFSWSELKPYLNPAFEVPR